MRCFNAARLRLQMKARTGRANQAPTAAPSTKGRRVLLPRTAAWPIGRADKRNLPSPVTTPRWATVIPTPCSHPATNISSVSRKGRPLCRTGTPSPRPRCSEVNRMATASCIHSTWSSMRSSSAQTDSAEPRSPRRRQSAHQAGRPRRHSSPPRGVQIERARAQVVASASPQAGGPQVRLDDLALAFGGRPSRSSRGSARRLFLSPLIDGSSRIVRPRDPRRWSGSVRLVSRVGPLDSALWSSLRTQLARPRRPPCSVSANSPRYPDVVAQTTCAAHGSSLKAWRS